MLTIINKTNYKDLEKYYNDLNIYYEKTLKILKIKGEADVSLILVGPITIKRINSSYRNIDKVTDVLSFEYLENHEDKYVEELGDIFINRNRVISQAKDYKHSIKREFIFLFIHGLLHLLGYDHMNDKDEKKMLAIQKKIIGDLK